MLKSLRNMLSRSLQKQIKKTSLMLYIEAQPAKLKAFSAIVHATRRARLSRI